MSVEDGAVMTFREHLLELRSRLVKVALVLFLGFFVGWDQREAIFGFLSAPITSALADNGIYHYQAIQVGESIFVYLKAVLIADLVVMSPLVFYQLWAFVAPGLHAHERRLVLPVTIFSVVFFALGAAFAYTVILPFITDWLVKLTVQGGAVEMVVTMQNAYSTAFAFLLMFGLVFELPLVVYFLALFGLTTHRALWRFWRYFVVLSFVVGAILTPPDPISQFLMAVPLNGLYGFGILVAWSVDRAREKHEAAGRPEGESVGVSSLRLIGAGFALLVLAGALAVAVVRALPPSDLETRVPPEAAFVAAFHQPRDLALGTVGALMAGQLAVPSLAGVLGDAGVPPEAVRHVTVWGDGAGRRLALVRLDPDALDGGANDGDEGSDEDGGVASGLADALVGALSATARPAAAGFGGEARPYAVKVGALDEATLAVGAAGLFDLQAAVFAGQAEAVAVSELDERLLGRLRAAGPVWAWLPRAPERAARVLGAHAEARVEALGAWSRAPGRGEAREGAAITVELRAQDARAAQLVQARLDALRAGAGATVLAGEQRVLAQALLTLAGELRPTLPAARAARVAAAEARVRALLDPSAGAPADLAPPLLAHLGARAAGWSVTRRDAWVSLTVEADAPLAALVRALDAPVTAATSEPPGR